MKAKKKAFTLTELLVVVVIIGVLSAVVLPKFTKMLEGFKAAEAEHFLEAVRNEQEARCTLGKDYTTNRAELASWFKGDSKHFDYTLNGSGMTAQRKGESYSLSILSYEDGRICCDNCDGLNKNYISCTELQGKSDFIAFSPCTGSGSDGCPSRPDDTSRSCGCSGHYVDHFNTTSCTWEQGTECVGDDPSQCEQTCTQTDRPTSPCGCTGHYEYTWSESECEWQPTGNCVEDDPSQCGGNPPARPDNVPCGCGGHQEYSWNEGTSTWELGVECVGNDTSHSEGEQITTQGTGTAGDGTNTCGTKIEEYSCINDSWSLVTVQDFESCGDPEPCVQTQEPEVSCGCGGHYQQTWNQEECRWDQSEVCVGETQPESPSASCGCNDTGHYEYTWNQNTCTWETDGVCVGETQPQMPSASCGCNDTGHYEYTWNQNTCTWETDSVCVGEDVNGCEGSCKWKKSKENLIYCTLPWETYCSLTQQNSGSVNWVPFLRQSANCNIGTYYSSSGVCSQTPTSPSDVCMAYENHIVPPNCESGNIPSGNVTWGVARKYVAECSALSRY